MSWIIYTFCYALVFNWAWEELHNPLFTHYKGGQSSHWILFRSALFDAVVITILLSLFYLLAVDVWQLVVIAVIFAVGLEWWALKTNRWSYAETMPIIPILKVGLTPVLQLGFIVWLVYIITP